MKPEIAIFIVFFGCCVNVVFLELLIKYKSVQISSFIYLLLNLLFIYLFILNNREDPGCGNLITFSQFVVIAIEGFVTTMQFGKRKLQVPFK